MEWHVLGSFGGSSPTCRMTSFLINGELALDAGSITQALPIEDQRRIQRIVLTHSHLDHTASIPFLVENVFGEPHGTLEILVTPQALRTVKLHLFNNDTWPDFSTIPNHTYPSVRFQVMEPELPFAIATDDGALEITPVAVNHVVPTTGLLLRQGSSSLLFTSDTGPTERAWEVANAAADLAAVITECSFPNRLQAVADASLHLTPATLAGELAKLHRDVAVYLYHFKPPYLEELRAELAAATLPHPVTELVQDRTYTF